MKKIEEMNKAELMEMVQSLSNEVEVLKVKGKRGSGRKLELLEQLAKGPAKILDLAGAMKVSSKNVSSLKTYLKKDGWGIINDEEGRTKITKFKGKAVDGKYIQEFVAKERKLMEQVEQSAQPEQATTE